MTATVKVVKVRVCEHPDPDTPYDAGGSPEPEEAYPVGVTAEAILEFTLEDGTTRFIDTLETPGLWGIWTCDTLLDRDYIKDCQDEQLAILKLMLDALGLEAPQDAPGSTRDSRGTEV